MARVPDIQPQDLGLKIYHDPRDVDEIEVDVVAVHGIGAHPKITWTHKKTGINWLAHETMLPAALPRARIMAFGYNSVWFGPDPVKQSLDGVASKLLGALVRGRKECPLRPIIFIAHCFGGLVIQKAYTMSSLHNTDWPNISQSIRGMVFLATPFAGVENKSGLTTQGQVYEAIVAASFQIQDNALLTLAQDNDVLVSTVHEFTRKLSTSNPKPTLFCFYEQKATNIGAIVSKISTPEFVVSESSATLATHRKEGLALDHFGMNKFENEQDNHYQCVLEQIIGMAKEAKDFLEHGDLVVKETAPKPTPRDVRIPVVPDLIEKRAYFAPRGEILRVLDERFLKKTKVALCGESGYGKTHIAVEYAHKFCTENPGSRVYWVNASSVAEFELSYKRIATSLHLPMQNPEHGGFLEAVRDRLKSDSGAAWLMVLDGLDGEDCLTSTYPAHGGKALLSFLPNFQDARILITTRNKLLATQLVDMKAKYVVTVDALSTEDASRLLFAKVTKESGKKEFVDDIVSILNGSAGALELARYYRGKAGKAVTRPKLLEKLKSQSTSKSTSAQPAWSLLFELLKSQHPDAADCMLTISALDVQVLPACFFTRHEKSEWIPILTDFGIVEASLDKTFYRIPALFRRCARDWLAERPEKRLAIEEMALINVSSRWNDDNGDALLPSALAATKFQPSSAAGKHALETLLGQVLRHQGQREVGLGRSEDVFKPESSDRRSTKECGLAGVTRKAIEYPSAHLPPLSLPFHPVSVATSGPGSGVANHTSVQPFHPPSPHQQAVVKKSRVPGSRVADLRRRLQELESSDPNWENDETLRVASDLGTLMLSQHEPGGSKEAVSIYRRLLDGHAGKHATPLETSRWQYNLALAHQARGQNEEAEKLYNSALGTIKLHGEPGGQNLEETELALTIHGSLAGMYASSDRFGDAEKAFKTVLPAQVRVLGPDHPRTLATRQNFATLLQECGNMDAAGDELMDVLKAQYRTLGCGHRDTLRTVCSVAQIYALRGHLETSEHLYRDVLKEQEASLGDSHCDTVTTRRMLNELLHQTEM